MTVQTRGSDRPHPQTVILCGHQRSGTTMLRRVLNTNPDVAITSEFRSFSRLGCTTPRYLLGLRWRRLGRGLAPHRYTGPRRSRVVAGIAFRFSYVTGILRRCPGRVSLDCVRATLSSLLPFASIVGDKYPGYVFRLDSLAAVPDLKRIVIYRDCRDVVSSTLAMVATAWKNSRFATNVDTPAKAAARWVEAIEQQERNAGSILTVRYEDLVTEPASVLRQLSEYLGTDPSRFHTKFIRATSIGKHRGRLSAAALAEIDEIAGETMRRLGYQSP